MFSFTKLGEALVELLILSRPNIIIDTIKQGTGGDSRESSELDSAVSTISFIDLFLFLF